MQIYRKAFTWEDVQRYLRGGMSRPFGTAGMWGLRERRSHGFWLELWGRWRYHHPDGEQWRGGGASLGETVGLFQAALRMPLSLSLGLMGGWETECSR